MTDNLSSKIVVKTMVYPTTIEQTITEFEPFDTTGKNIWYGVIDLKDKGIREALITLGWTPPKGNKP